MLMQVILNLGLVLCCMMAFYYFAVKVRQKKAGNGTSIEMLASLSIGTKEKIILINAAGSRLLLGITPNQITTLKTYDYIEPKPEPVFDLVRKLNEN